MNIQFMVAAPSSGSGKTIITCALLYILKKNGFSPCAFKCGPDYIDPMFHRSVLGIESHNLDTFLSGDVSQFFSYYMSGGESKAPFGSCVCEGVMGLYDGLGGISDTASAWNVADILGLPILLVIRPHGVGLTIAAQIKGLLSFRADSHIAGIILNDCSSSQVPFFRGIIEKETGIPVLGCLPHSKAADIGSRHLGLYTAGEIDDLNTKISETAKLLEENCDIKKLFELMDKDKNRKEKAVPVEPLEKSTDAAISEQLKDKANASRVRIAVAHDEAFCFMYDETLDILKKSGAELVFFSPLHDDTLPDDIGGVYLPGGYPELHLSELEKNEAMKSAVKAAFDNKMPIVAECGGFLYLGQSITSQDGCEGKQSTDLAPAEQTKHQTKFTMCGCLKGDASFKGKPIRFGYNILTAKEDSLLFRKGEKIPSHEFHYFDMADCGDALTATKPLNGKQWMCGVVSDSLYAGFPHLYMAGRPELAQRFVNAAKKYIEMWE